MDVFSVKQELSIEIKIIGDFEDQCCLGGSIDIK